MGGKENQPQIAMIAEPVINFPTAPGAFRPISPTMQLVQDALATGNVELIDKFLTLHERYEANLARKAFDAAIADAKAEIPVIRKNKHVGFKSKDPSKGSTDYDYEDFAEIARTVDPIISKYGLSYRFRVSQNQQITVVCILSHRDGHFEENELTANADTSGNKNSIQAIGSTITFFQRYTLKCALGLAASKDDDARAISQTVKTISAEQIEELTNLAEEAGVDKIRFCRFFGIESFSEILVSRFGDAKAAIEAKRNKVSKDV